MAGTPKTSRNVVLSRGVQKYSRSQMYKRSGKWAIKNKNTVKAAPKPKAVVEKKFGKGTRVICKKDAKFYPADKIHKPLKSRKHNRKLTKLRSNITPGTVLILLAGKHMSRRVIFLKQLSSGLLLVTGPYKVNGVPLRRVNQAYVVSTSTKIDLDLGDSIDKFDDAYFRKEKKAKHTKSEEEFFETKEEKVVVPEHKKADQKSVDAVVSKNITPELKGYLSERWTLRNGQYPHQMTF